MNLIGLENKRTSLGMSEETESITTTGLHIGKNGPRVIEQVIHLINPKAMIFVSGVNGPVWSADLSAMPLAKRRRQTSCIAHFYPDVKTGNDTGTSCLAVRRAPERPARHRPDFYGEWGPNRPDSDRSESDMEQGIQRLPEVYLNPKLTARPFGLDAWSWADEHSW